MSYFVGMKEINEMLDNNNIDEKIIELYNTNDKPIREIVNQIADILEFNKMFLDRYVKYFTNEERQKFAETNTLITTVLEEINKKIVNNELNSEDHNFFIENYYTIMQNQIDLSNLKNKLKEYNIDLHGEPLKRLEKEIRPDVFEVFRG